MEGIPHALPTHLENLPWQTPCGGTPHGESPMVCVWRGGAWGIAHGGTLPSLPPLPPWGGAPLVGAPLGGGAPQGGGAPGGCPPSPSPALGGRARGGRPPEGGVSRGGREVPPDWGGRGALRGVPLLSPLSLPLPPLLSWEGGFGELMLGRAGRARPGCVRPGRVAPARASLAGLAGSGGLPGQAGRLGGPGWARAGRPRLRPGRARYPGRAQIAILTSV